MTDRKKLIEVALPLEAINEASAREKSIRHGHPSTLHLWWARRPLAACRAVIFTSLVDDPDNPNAPEAFVAACKKLPKGKNAAENDTPRQRLFDFIERLVTWEATTDEAILEQARELIRLSTDGNPPPLLDPFAGGGSIPLEAQRLGLEAHASDLNPVAVMINKAMIEIPPLFKDQPPVNPRDRAKMGAETRWKGAAGLAADVRYYGEWMREQAWKRIGHLYPKCNGETVIAWLWARTVKCPNPACNKIIPLTKTFDLCRKKGKNIWLKPVISPETNEIIFQIQQAEKSNRHMGTVSRNGAICLACETPVSLDYIREQAQMKGLGSQLLAIVTDGNPGRNYYPFNEKHYETAMSAKPDFDPNTPLTGKARVSVPLYGMETHGDLFTDRQLVGLSSLSELIHMVKKSIFSDATETLGLEDEGKPLKFLGTGPKAYSEAISVYCSFLIDKIADLSNNLCRWEPFAECPRALFARQAIPMVWDFAEPNLFSDSSGSINTQLDNFYRSLMSSAFNFHRERKGYVLQKDARRLDDVKGIPISTDPPYYDNIEYADLSDFFYIWLRRSLLEIYPEILSTILVPKESELIASSFRFSGNSDKAESFFESGLHEVFQNFKNIIPSEYPLSIYYAFKQEEIHPEKGKSSTGWEKMLESLIHSGFSIVGTWPVRTEMSSRMVGQGTNALASSIVLVCRPINTFAETSTRRDYLRYLRDEVPKAVFDMQSGNIAPVDLAQAAIGPGMAVYSRYSKVLEPDGSELTVRTALQLINQVLDEYLAEQEGAMDQASRFAVTWFSQYGFDTGPYGQAEVLSKAKDTSVEGMARHGILEAEAGKVRLLRWDELDPGQSLQSGMVWAATHLLIERLNTHGETGAAELLASLPPDLAADARALAYRLYSIADRKGWSALARNYNALVVSWNEAQEEARGIRKNTPQQGSLFDDEA